MKLTKGMKKALSLLLAGALAISGANTGVIANAAATETKTIVWTGTAVCDKPKQVIETTKADKEITVVANEWNNKAINVTVDVTGMSDLEVLVEGTEAEFKATYGILDSKWKVIEGDNQDDDISEITPTSQTAISAEISADKVENNTLTLYVVNGGRTVKKITVTGTVEKTATDEEDDKDTAGSDDKDTAGSDDKDTAGSDDKDTAGSDDKDNAGNDDNKDNAGTSDNNTGDDGKDDGKDEGNTDVTPDPEKRANGTMEGFWVDMVYVSAGWSEQYWGDAATKVVDGGVEVTKNGTYKVTYKAQQDSKDIMMVWLETNLHNKDIAKTFKIAPTKLSVGSTDYKLDWTDGLMTFADSDFAKGLRSNIRNPYNMLVGADMSTAIAEDPVDTLKGEVAVKAGDDITVEFEVSGMDPKADKVDYSTVNPDAGFTYNEKPAAPAPNTTVAPSTNASVVASPATAKIEVAKKKIVIAAKKSKSVKFTAVPDGNATSAAIVTASVKGKKVTATIKDGKVVIKVGKKAVKGSKATVTLTSKNASGVAVTADIKVTVQNKAKKIKAPKKVTLKKGKTKKVVIKVKKAENNKKAITDKVTAKIKKIAKVKSVKAQKGKIVITLKAKKKGSAKMTVKVASIKKKAKINVKVK